MSTRLIITAAGTAIGAYLGGPQGAAWGYALGSAAGNLVDPAGEDIQGPRLDDLSVQTSSYGAPIPRHYGTVRAAGNLIWSSGLIEKQHEEDAGGKGGGPTVTSYTYSASFAISFGEGPIAGIRRIWADSKLLYDKSDTASAESLLASEGKATGIRIYAGTETQLADATIEAYEGVGNVPAYRGQCYIVCEELQLADFGNRIPNMTAEIIADGAVVAGRRLVAVNPTGVLFFQYSPFVLGEGYATMDADGGVYRIPCAPTAIAVPDRVLVFGLNGQMIGREAPRSGEIRIKATSSNNRFIGFLGAYRVEVTFEPVGGASATLPLYAQGLSGDMEFADLAELLPDGVWIRAAVPSANHERVLICTSLLNGGEGTNWYLVGLNGANPYIAASGPLTGDEFMVASGHGRNIFYAGMGESDLVHWWCVEGAGSATVACYRLTAGQAPMEVLRLTGLSQGLPFTNFTAPALSADDGVMFVVSGPSSAVFTRLPTLTSSAPTLASIVTNLCAACGLVPADINVSALTGTVLGYTRSRPMNVRAALQPLQQAYFFDLVESDWTLKFIPRGGASIRTITEDNLACHEYGAERPEALEITRVQELELPRRVHVQYLSKVRNYQTDEQYSARLITESDQITNVQLPVVMTATKARQVAEVLHYDAWTERLQYPIALGPEHLDLDPGDVITVIARGGTHTVRITNTNLALPGLCALQGVADDAAVYVSEAEGAETIVPERGIGLEGPTRLELLDIPMLRDADDNAGIYAAASGYLTGWRGAQVFKSNDGGDTHAAQQAITRKAVIGNATNALASGPTTIIDRGNTLNVRLLSGTLSSITELALLNGGNHAVLGADDRWEVLGFQTAALQADGTYTLSGLLRGRRGTEAFLATHVVGDTFVLLTEATLSRLSVDLAAIGQTREYKGVSFGRTLQRTAAQEIAHNAVALKPYAPAHIAGSRDGSGNLTISWVRRTRIGGELRDFVEVPLGETSESYEVEVYSGATLKRTLTGLGSASAAYSASLQTTDFGAAQASVSVKVYQLSAAVGRGTAGAATV